MKRARWIPLALLGGVVFFGVSSSAIGQGNPYVWSPVEVFQATWNSPPTATDTHLKPGDKLTFSWTCPDDDWDTRLIVPSCCETIHYEPLNGVWLLRSDIGSQFDQATKEYTAGNTYPTGLDGKGNDRFYLTIDDKPEPVWPGDDGSRDDRALTIGTERLFVHFPTAAIKTGHVGPTPTQGTGWRVDTTWTVVDQWGQALPGVTVSENPTTICPSSPNHNTANHLYGITLTGGPVVTDANGNFTDAFIVLPTLPTGKAVTFKQIYSAVYGTYSDSVLTKYRGKIINHRPDPDMRFDFTAEPWPDAAVNCATNQ